MSGMVPFPDIDGPWLTGNRIKRAGKLLRNWSSDTTGRLYSQAEIEEAFEILLIYRRRFSGGRQPLASVSMSLRSMVVTATEIEEVEVTQRLKRADRIIEKLVRHPRMQLTTMDDIGGCRVVVPTLGDLDKLQRYLHRRWGDSVKTRRNYVADPKPTGYRAYHLVVIRHGMPIEVQRHRLAAELGEHGRAGRGDDRVDAQGRPGQCRRLRYVQLPRSRLWVP